MNTLVTLRDVLPTDLRQFVPAELEQQILQLEPDPTIREHITKNMISYVGVLRENRSTLESYLHAVAYCTHRLTEDSRVVAYAKTFPNKYASLVASGANASTISKYATSYEKTKLVSGIMEQSVVPTWIVNQDIYQQAINVQKELMLTANSEKVRCDAANSLITHLARPEKVAPLVNINIGSNNELDLLKQSMVDLALNQRGRIMTGTPTKLIADEDIVNGTSN